MDQRTHKPSMIDPAERAGRLESLSECLSHTLAHVESLSHDGGDTEAQCLKCDGAFMIPEHVFVDAMTTGVILVDCPCGRRR